MGYRGKSGDSQFREGTKGRGYHFFLAGVEENVFINGIF
jgi:hypothetical protein